MCGAPQQPASHAIASRPPAASIQLAQQPVRWLAARPPPPTSTASALDLHAWALFVCRGGVIMIADLRIRMRVGRCGSWLPLADFWGVGGLQPRVARPKSTDSYCFQGGVGVHSAS